MENVFCGNPIPNYQMKTIKKNRCVNDMPTSEVTLVMHYPLHPPIPLMSEAKAFVLAAVDT